MNGIPPHMMPGQFMQGGMGGMHPVSLAVYLFQRNSCKFSVICIRSIVPYIIYQHMSHPCNLVRPALCPLQMMVPGMGGPGMGGPGMGGPGMGGPGMMGPMGMPVMGPMAPGMRPPMGPGPDADPQRMMFYKTRICHACAMLLCFLMAMSACCCCSAP